MDHLALFDGLASTSLNLTGLPAAADLDLSSSYRRDSDKGKARARDDLDDETTFHAFLSAPAESSRSARSLSALSDNTSRFRDTRSADHSDAKGKARQLFADMPASTSAPVTDSHSLRTSRTSTPTHLRQCERSVSASCSYNDEASLKRSIRQMGSSPSSSPRQQTRLLPPAQACSSTSQLSLDHITSDAPSTSSLSAASVSPHARPATTNKRRRSLRSGGDINDDALATLSDRHAHRAYVLETAPVDHSLRSETHARRASLLVNSSTRDSHSFESDPTLCVAPEPLDSLSRSEQPSSDLSHRRSAFLASARAQRSGSTVRRRRGFYLRDADLLRNDPSEESLASSSDRPNSSTSDTFMAEFARAVDLRLTARSDTTQPSAFTSSASSAPQVHHQQPSRGATAQPNAPQLPLPRTASPLSISFAAAEADHPRQEAQRGLAARPNLRRRVPVSTQGASSHADQDATSSAATSRSTLFHQASWPTSPSHQPDQTSSAASPTHLETYGRHTSTQRESHAWRVDYRRADAVATAAAPDPERLDLGRPFHAPTSAHTLDSRTREHATADDFGAVQRPFGLRGTRLTARPYRPYWSRAEDGPELGPIAAAEADRVHSANVRQRDEDRSTDQAREQRDFSPLPWRTSHFGLHAPSRGAAEPPTSHPSRFEPFDESLHAEMRRPSGLTGSRSSLSTSPYWERHENESALEYLGRVMSHDSMLDESMAGDVHGPLLRMAIESHVLQPHFSVRHLGHAPASTSSMLGQSPHLALDARNFITDEDWAELTYERLARIGEQLGAAEIRVPQSLIDTLPTCEYGDWDGGSCRQRDALSASPPLVGKGKGKQKVKPRPSDRDTMCPICREDYLDSDLLMSINKCCHAFHADCIKTWFKTAKTCPLCRADAFDEISLPALPFESSSTSTTTTSSRAAPLIGSGGGSFLPTWNFNF